MQEDFSDFLKKAIESEMNLGKNEEETNSCYQPDWNLADPPTGKDLKLAFLAKKKKEQIVEQLTDYLNTMDRTDPVSCLAHACVKIETAAKKISILDVIMISRIFGNNANTSDSIEELIQTIINNCII